MQQSKFKAEFNPLDAQSLDDPTVGGEGNGADGSVRQREREKVGGMLNILMREGKKKNQKRVHEEQMGERKRKKQQFMNAYQRRRERNERMNEREKKTNR